MEDDLEEELRDLLKQKQKLITRNSGSRSRLSELSKICNRLGEILFQMGRYKESLDEHAAEEAACATIEDTLGVAIANRKIGECYAELCQHDKALHHQTKHLELAREVRNQLEEQRALATIGRTHLYHAETLRSQPNSILNRDVDITEALNKAEEAFFKSLDVCERLSTNEVGIRELAQMRGRLFLNLGLVIEQRGDLRNSISFIEKAISLHKQYSQWEDLERCHHSLSLIYQKHADITNSLSHASKSLEIAKKLNDHKLQYEVLFLMGQLLLQQGNYSEAKRMLRKVRRLINSAGTEDKEIIKLLKVAVKLQHENECLTRVDNNDLQAKMKIYEKMGDLFSRGSLFKNAIDCYAKALSIAEKSQLSRRDLAPLYLSLAQTYMDCEQYDRASQYYDLEMQCWEENPGEKCRTVLNLAECRERLGEGYPILETLYLESLNLARIAENPKLEKECLETLSVVQESFGELQKRNNTLKLLDALLKDSNKHCSSEEDNENSSSDESSLFLSGSSSEDASDGEKINNIQRVCCPKTRKTFRLTRNEKGETPLHRACIAGDIKKVERLLSQGHPVNVSDYTGWFPIHEAANNDHPEIVQLLLENGARVNDSCDGFTPLHDSASNGNLEVMKILLQHGAPLLAKTNAGETVVDCLIAWAKRASAENGDSVAISDGIRFAEELQQKMAQLENLSSQAEMEEMPLANKECETPQRGIRSKLNSRKVKKKRGITGVVSDEDLNASSPVLVEEGKILPASDDWLIDDIGITKQNKRRKCDILSWVEEGNRLNRSTFETSNYERPKLEPRQTRKRKQRHEDQNVDTCEDVSLPSQEHDSVVSVASTLPQSYQSPPTSGASTMRIKVKILDKLLLIPVPKGETISWLSKEASQRYFVMTGLRPMLNLSTKEGASLSPEDAVDVVVSSGEEVVGTLQSWDLAPLAERYHEACESLKTELYDNVRQRLTKAETSFVAAFANLKLSHTPFQPVFRALQCQFNLRELILSGNRIGNQGLQTLGVALQRLPALILLDISSNDISDISLGQLVQPLTTYKEPLQMQSLLLDFNPLLEDGCSNLLLLLRCLPNLTTLSLKSISLEPGAVVPPPLLSEALAAGTRLEHLDLSFTRLSVEDLDNLFVSLSQLPLVQLNLTAVLSERSKVLACHRLSNYFRNGSPRLRHLSLAHCSLDDNCLDELLQRLSEKTLDHIDLTGNPCLTRTKIAAISKAMPMCDLKLSSSSSLLSSLKIEPYQPRLDDIKEWVAMDPLDDAMFQSITF